MAHKRIILFLTVVLLPLWLAVSCATRHFGNLKSAPVSGEEGHWSFPDRRLFLLENISSLGITSHVTTQKNCMAQANDLVFRLPGSAEGITPALETEIKRLLELQSRYRARFNKRLEFIAVQSRPECRAFSSKGSGFEFKAEQKKQAIGQKLDSISIYFPAQMSAKEINAADDFVFRAVLFEENTRQLDQGRSFPVTLIRVQDSADLSFAGGPGAGSVEVQTFIGKGAFGMVYDAKWGADHAAAFKVFRTDSYIPLRLRLSLMRLAAFCESEDGSHFCAQDLLKPESTGWYYDRATDQYYLGQIMPRADNRSMGRRFDEWNPLVSEGKAELEFRLSRMRDFGSRLLKLSRAIRAAGYSHNDIKPANILFVSGRPVVADLDSFSRCGEEPVLAMTPDYIPPELLSQRKNESNPPSNCLNDLFAIGSTLYQLLTLSNLNDAMFRVSADAQELQSAENEVSKGFSELETKAKDLGISKKAFADLKWLETTVRAAIARDTAKRITAYDQL
jgi:Protein kinase domain